MSSTASRLQPFVYTSGRWLKGEEQQLRARFRRFDYDALCSRVIRTCPGARSIVRTEKKEGGFNRVFLFDMDNGVRRVARIPYYFSGPSRLATHSEVATIAYVRRHTTVPTPEVLDWSDESNSAVGSNFIIMAHVPGVQLHQRWQTMNHLQQFNCVRTLSQFATDVAKLTFPAYGSIYFSDDAPIPKTMSIDLGQGFCLGPHCGHPAWPCDPQDLEICTNKFSVIGPWFDFQAYCSHLVDVGLSRLPTTGSDSNKLKWWGSPEEHRHLLEITRKILRIASPSPRMQQIASPMLFHPDLHKRNVYVDDNDPSKVTALVDWQSASVQPTFVYAGEEPDFVVMPEMPALLRDKLPPAENHSSNAKHMWRCRQMFEVALRGFVPLLGKARASEDVILSVLMGCTSTWKNSIVPLQHALTVLSTSWSSLGVAETCPYQPSTADVEQLTNSLEECASAQSLRDGVVSLTCSTSDGWVHPDDWEETQEVNRDLYGKWLQATEEADEDLEAAKAIYPFDVV